MRAREPISDTWRVRADSPRDHISTKATGSDCGAHGCKQRTAGKSKAIPSGSSGWLGQTSLHQKHGGTQRTSRGIQHFHLVSACGPLNTESPWAPPSALAAFTPKQRLSKPRFVSAGAESCPKSSQTDADAGCPVCQRCTHNTWAPMGSPGTRPCCAEGPRTGVCGVLGQRHFL